MLNSFSRTELLLGRDAMERLSKARVAIFGIGGVGGYAVEALARSGVGTLDLIDDDKVCLTNINRQIIATTSTIGKYKVDVAEERIKSINPHAVVHTYKTFYMPDTAKEFDFSQYDYVIDAIDTVSAKIALAKLCEDRGLPLVCSSGAADRFFPERLSFANIYDTHDCGLCRILRKEARKRGIKRWTILYSDEPSARELLGTPRLPEPEQVPGERRRKLPLGTTSWMPPIMGQMIAGYVICSLMGLENGGRSL